MSRAQPLGWDLALVRWWGRDQGISTIKSQTLAKPKMVYLVAQWSLNSAPKTIATVVVEGIEGFFQGVGHGRRGSVQHCPRRTNKSQQTHCTPACDGFDGDRYRGHHGDVGSGVHRRIIAQQTFQATEGRQSPRFDGSQVDHHPSCTEIVRDQASRP